MKFLKKYWDLVIGMLLIIYHFIVIATYGVVSFNEVFLASGIILVVYHYGKFLLKSNKYINRALRIVTLCIILGFIVFAIVESAIVMFPKNDTSKSDYIIALGAGVRGEQISLTLKQRLDKVIEYNKNNKDTQIIVSGGQGSDENISEAEAMKRYLVSEGINNDNIIMEDKSTSTSENFKFSRSVIEKLSNKPINEVSIKIITSDFHALRSKMLAKREGYEDITFFTSKTIPLIAPIMYTREFFAMFKSYLLD